MYYYVGENEPKMDPSSQLLGIYKVKSLEDYTNAKDQLQKLKDLYSKMGEEKPEIDDESMGVSEAIIEQEKQMQIFIEGLADYNTEFFSKNLDLLLKANKMRISELEAILQVSAGYISRTIGNDSKRRLSVDVLWKIAELFHINIDDLLNRDLTAPTKDLKQVISFVKKLHKETDSERIRWENIGIKPNDKNEMFFPFENGDYCFLPTRMPLILCDLRGGYSVNISIGTIYLFEDSISQDHNEYSMYLYDENVRDNYGIGEDPLIKITISSSDSSGILEAECKKLINAIRTHEKDFVVSDAARNYMDRYLNPKNYGGEEELPF